MSDNKTEKPTPRRRQKAREQGQIARSRDLSSTLAVSGTVGLIAWQGYSGIETWRTLLRHTLEFSGAKPLADRSLISVDWMDAGACAVPVMATAWMLAVFGGVAQGGMVFAPGSAGAKNSAAQPAPETGTDVFSDRVEWALEVAAALRGNWLSSASPLSGNAGRHHGRLQHRPLVPQPLSPHRSSSRSRGNPRWCCWSGRWWITS